MNAVEARASFPERVGRYTLLVPIASGGAATVYLARQIGEFGFAREVALKLTHAHLREVPEWSTELIEEAKLACRIRHPNVVPVLDVGDDPNGVFLVMDYVEGETLYALIRHSLTRGRALPVAVGLRILVDALMGLHAAHELCDDAGAPVGLVHRDFSPQNVLVGVDGVARLSDFGVAKATSRVGLTRTGVVKGKFGYMAPEQVRDRALDRRTDLWAAGVVAWEMLAGRRLYPSSDQAATLFRIVTEEPPRLREVRADLPLALDDAIASALVLDASQRCATADELARRLTDAWATEGGLATAHDVAAYVRDAFGATLAARKAAATEAFERASARAQPGAQGARESPRADARSPATRRRNAVLIVGSLIGAAAVYATARLPRAARTEIAPEGTPTVDNSSSSAAEAAPAPIRADDSATALIPASESVTPRSEASPRASARGTDAPSRAQSPRTRSTAPAPTSAPDRVAPLAPSTTAPSPSVAKLHPSPYAR